MSILGSKDRANQGSNLEGFELIMYVVMIFVAYPFMVVCLSKMLLDLISIREDERRLFSGTLLQLIDVFSDQRKITIQRLAKRSLGNFWLDPALDRVHLRILPPRGPSSSCAFRTPKVHQTTTIFRINHYNLVTSTLPYENPWTIQVRTKSYYLRRATAKRQQTELHQTTQILLYP
ncbi:hypothetical protein ACH5RR_011962 [Cinchona calisaya]|uniref:Uncharacterized protein n=1 Tax=Cinchona calisaya TaxID=153742 RepID=A0ABD3A8X1_9GENT